MRIRFELHTDDGVQHFVKEPATEAEYIELTVLAVTYPRTAVSIRNCRLEPDGPSGMFIFKAGRLHNIRMESTPCDR